jgi:hypothetical protein
MSDGKGLNLVLFFAITVTAFGLLTTLLFASSPPMNQENISWRKPLVGSVFSLICITGITATFFPDKCTRTFHSQARKRQSINGSRDFAFNEPSIAVKGHHPDCGKFSAHTILVDGHVFCAACTGLLFGGTAALIGTGLYFFAGWGIGQLDFWCVLAGQTAVFLGFIQLKFRGYARLFVNTLFVFGAFLTLAGTDNLVANLLVDLYSIGLVLFWLWTRIIISQWDHRRICSRCQVCRETEEKKDLG